MNAQTRERLLSSLGLCAKAGKLIYGVPMICDAMRGRRERLVVLCAADNAANSTKKLTDKCRFYGAELLTLPVDGEELARAVGKTARLAAVAVTDENLVRLVKKHLGQTENE